MTIDRSIERRITTVLADEAPQRVPTDLADTILARTRPRSPRSRWLVLLTESPMRLEPEVAFGSSTARSFAFLGEHGRLQPGTKLPKPEPVFPRYVEPGEGEGPAVPGKKH